MFRCVLVLLIGLSLFSLSAPRVTTAMIVTVQQADVDQDGHVTVLDLALVAKSIGVTTTGRADVDGDGKVSILDLTAVAMHLLQAVPANTSVEQLIATRGDNLLPHDITLPAPVSAYDWGQHGIEWARSLQPDSHTAASWAIVYPDVAQSVGGIGAVRYNIRRIALWNFQPSNSTWVKVFDGKPDWYSVLSYGLTTYTDVVPTIEPDGSYSFSVPTGQMLHVAMNVWPTITESGGTIALIESRLLGTPAAVAAAVVGDAAGVDYRGAGGTFSGFSTPGYHAASSGHFQRLTGNWQTNLSLSTAMTDAQVRANPPLLR